MPKNWSLAHSARNYPLLRKGGIVGSTGVVLFLIILPLFRLGDRRGTPVKDTNDQRSKNKMGAWKVILETMKPWSDLKSLKIIVVMMISTIIFSFNELARARIQGELFRLSVLANGGFTFKRRFLKYICHSLIFGFVLSASNKGIAQAVSRLGRHWGDKLAGEMMRLYFSSICYYKLQQSEAQRFFYNRLTSDAYTLTRDLALVTNDAINTLIKLGFFGYHVFKTAAKISGKSSDGLKLIFGPILYLLFVLACLRIRSPDYTHQRRHQRTLDELCRHSFSRIGDPFQSESIAAYEGEQYESDILVSRHKEAIEYTKRVASSNCFHEILKEYLTRYGTYSLVLTCTVIPFMGGGREINRKRSLESDAKVLSDFRYLASMMSLEVVALAQLGRLTNTFLKLGGLVSRCSEFITTMNNMVDNGCVQNTDKYGNSEEASFVHTPIGYDDSIIFESVDVVSPSGNILVVDLSFEVKRGENLLICGPNGSGKSSIFRCLGGLWPIAKGRIRLPGGGMDRGLHSSEVFYLPQKPYCPIGTLVSNIVYPEDQTLFVSEESHRLMDLLLKLVDLDHLRPFLVNNDNKVRDWGTSLSLGEQQQLAMARLFWRRPMFAILDECTSALSVKMEKRLFSICKQSGISVVTISHRPSLEEFHDKILILDGSTGYRIKSLKENTSVPVESHTGNGRTENENGKACRSDPFTRENRGKNVIQENIALYTTIYSANRRGSSELRFRRTSSEGIEHSKIFAAITRERSRDNLTRDETRGAWNTDDDEEETGTQETILEEGMSLRSMIAENTDECYKSVIMARKCSDTLLGIECVTKGLTLSGAQISSKELSSIMSLLKYLNPHSKDIVYAGIILIMGISKVTLSHLIAHISGDTLKYVLQNDIRGYLFKTFLSLLLCFVQACLSPLRDIMQQEISFLWNFRMTDMLLDKFLSARSYYKLGRDCCGSSAEIGNNETGVSDSNTKCGLQSKRRLTGGESDDGISEPSSLQTNATHFTNANEEAYEDVCDSSFMESCIDGSSVLIDDLPMLCSKTSSLAITGIMSMTELIWFSAQLWRLSGSRVLFFIYSYSILQGHFLSLIRPNLSLCVSDTEDRESLINNFHSRLAISAESVAFLDGGESEHNRVLTFVETRNQCIEYCKMLEHLYGVIEQYIVSSYGLNQAVSWSLTLMYSMHWDSFNPSNFGISDKIEMHSIDESKSLSHDLRYMSSALNHTVSSLGRIQTLFSKWTIACGHLDRIRSLSRKLKLIRDVDGCMDAKASPSSFAPQTYSTEFYEDYSGSCSIQVSNVDIITPDRSLVIATNLSLDISALCGPNDRSEHISRDYHTFLSDGPIVSANEDGMNNNIMLTGPNGSGKTAVMRTFLGLWDYFPSRRSIGVSKYDAFNRCSISIRKSPRTPRNAAHYIRVLNKQYLHYIPTRPYLPEGTLADLVSYPSRSLISDLDRIEESLSKVGLGYLWVREFGTGMDEIRGYNKTRVSGSCTINKLEFDDSVSVGFTKHQTTLHKKNDFDGNLETITESIETKNECLVSLVVSANLSSSRWDARLSLGEQQRIAIARMFFGDYRVVMLDECTSAVAIDGEEKIYKQMRAGGQIVVTASQKPWLLNYHGKRIDLSGELDGEFQILKTSTPIATPKISEDVYVDKRQNDNNNR